MKAKEKARGQAGQICFCAIDDSALTDEQRELLAELRAVRQLRDKALREHEEVVTGLELARVRLLADLRATGWREPPQQAGDE